MANIAVAAVGVGLGRVSGLVLSLKGHGEELGVHVEDVGEFGVGDAMVDEFDEAHVAEGVDEVLAEGGLIYLCAFEESGEVEAGDCSGGSDAAHFECVCV